VADIDEQQLPRDFGRYRLLDLLGQGGQARVFRAELRGAAGFRKLCALKIIRLDAFEEADRAAERLLEEARIGGLMRHPNIVDTYDVGELQGRVYIAMEFIHGITLGALIRRKGALPPGAALDLSHQICAGLAHAHALRFAGRKVGLVHQDLKPSNILLDRNGLLKLTDFGIANAIGLAVQNKGLGTPGYMSPEQLKRRPVDHRADLFCLGALIYLAATGARLFDGADARERMRRTWEVDAHLRQIKAYQQVEERIPGLWPVLQKLLRFDRDQRYNSAAEVAADLGSIVFADQDAELSQCVRIAQAVDHEDDAVEVFRRRTLGSIPAPQLKTNLGPEPNLFVGRHDELDKLVQVLTGTARLVTITGPGGVGKTRLARRLGNDLVEKVEGGVWFNDLSDARGAEDVVSITAVNFDHEGVADPMSVARTIRLRGRCLVVLDNFEQILDAAPSTLGRWLDLCPQARFLITSRERVRIGGEVVINIEPLGVDDAVALFVERARELDPRYSPGAIEMREVRTLCESLDGLPLAIELAAARIRTMKPGQMLRRLEERLDLLQDRGARPRRATLRGAIDWSWQLLAGWEKLALAQLSTFRGGLTVAAAESVLDLSAFPDAPWTLFVLESLIDKSLLRTLSTENEDPRFGMYQSLQAYAAEKLLLPSAVSNADGDSLTGVHAKSAVELRHGNWFAEIGVEGFLDTVQPGRHLWERDNLIAAAERAVERGDCTIASACAHSACKIFNRRGPLQAGARLAKMVRGMEGHAPARRLEILCDEAFLLRAAGRLEEAALLLEEGIRLARTLRDPSREATILGELGAVLRVQGQLGRSRKVYTRACELAKKDGNRRLLGRLIAFRGDLDRMQGRWETALRHYGQALQIAEQAKDRRWEAMTLTNLANLQVARGFYDEARVNYIHVHDLTQELGDRRFEGVALNNLGNLAREQGDYSTAKDRFEQSLGILRQIGDSYQQSIAEGNLGQCYLSLGDLTAARRHLEDAIITAKEIGAARNEGAFLGPLALASLQDGDIEHARGLLVRAEGLLRRVGDDTELAKCLCIRAQTEFMRGSRAVGMAKLDEAKELARKLEMADTSELSRSVANVEQFAT
jgi:predicted ATPase/serine/threonine protein kinase/predicted negative regulator of RcsB-dependent stress response